MCHKWLGCMLTAKGSVNHDVDVRYHLQQACRAYHANKWVLQDRKVSISFRLRYFQAVIISVACFGSSHRSIRRRDLRNLNVEFRKLIRSVVGPPAGISWDSPWHEILHVWNERGQLFCNIAGVTDWATLCLKQYWKLAEYVANLPNHRWLIRVLRWHPASSGRPKIGRPLNTWYTRLDEFCRYKGLGNWMVVATQAHVWNGLVDEFIQFCLWLVVTWAGVWFMFVHIVSPPVPLMGCPRRHTGLRLRLVFIKQCFLMWISAMNRFLSLLWSENVIVLDGFYTIIHIQPYTCAHTVIQSFWQNHIGWLHLIITSENHI